MPFLAHFHNPCLLPGDTSIHYSVPPRSASSINSILRRHLFKECAPIIDDHHQPLSTRTYPRRKISAMVRKIKFNNKLHSRSNNYDMTILHDDELENSRLATLRRRKKKIPSWADKNQLELAIINQVYFQETNPEDIFGTICIDDVFQMFPSIDMNNKELSSIIASRHFV